MSRDVGVCVEASVKGQIVVDDPPQHEASRLEPIRTTRQRHVATI
jgi:hypothetical protein